MSRKSKAKYEMKGHSIPGIKGFKGTTLEDGRAASSAFQMQSPLHEEGDAYELDDINVKSSDSDANRAAAQAAGQGGLAYAGQEFGKLEWKDGKLVRKGSEVEKDKITEQVDKYEDPVEGSNMDNDLNKTEIDINALELPEEEYAEPVSKSADLATKETIIPNVELKSSPGDPYSYRGTEDGGYEYKKGGGEWTKATGKGLESIKKRYEK
jgi:hypothetical protein